MDGDVLKDKIVETVKKIPLFYYIPAAIFICGLIFLVIGMMQFFSPPKNDSELLKQSNLPAPKSTMVEVDVEGAVENPGVYSIPSNSRLKDAVIAAGGLSVDADRGTIAKQLNFAVKVVDGAKVYIPKTSDTPITSGVAGTDTSTQVLGSTTGLINVNSASADILDSLPGVGSVTAQKIIDNRPYNSVDELLSKKVVGNAVYQKIKDKVSVY